MRRDNSRIDRGCQRGPAILLVCKPISPPGPTTEAALAHRLAPIDAEFHVLSTPEGRALLAEVSAVASPGPTDHARWRQHAPAEVVHAAARLAEARRKGRPKFALADRMWLDPIGVEQATSQAIAAHKALRLDARVVVDLCSGVGGDAIAAARRSRVLAVDLDPAMGRRLRWNAEVHGVGGRVLAVAARAERFAIPEGAHVHVDPDRRASGSGRARKIAGYVPDLGFLRSLMLSTRGGALKLGPASDFEAHFGGPGVEIELVSLGGECKEATAWYGDLAGCRRRATHLPSGASWSDRDGPAGVSAGVGVVEGLVYDPDPSLRRAGLVDGFAAAHGLRRIAPAVDLLVGRQSVTSPLLTTFEVIEELPMDLKRLRRAVADRGIGTLEIKVRGLDARPETLRRELRPAGGTAATLIVFGGRGPARAILCRRLG